MVRNPMWVLFIWIIFQFTATISETEVAKNALLDFMGQLTPPANLLMSPNWGWNASSDPCIDIWRGVSCEKVTQTVRRIVLDGFNMTGVLNAESLCTVRSLTVLSLNENDIAGGIPEAISNCRQLTHLYLRGNQFSGKLPDSLSKLSNLKRLDISSNTFSGALPDLPRISGLITFLAENNQLTGVIPEFNFLNLDGFNVSYNNFSGPIPNVDGRFTANSFSDNPGLCGKPLQNACPPHPHNLRGPSAREILMYCGYIVLVLAVLILVAFILFNRNKCRVRKERKSSNLENKSSDNTSEKFTGPSIDSRTNNHRSEYSISSIESGMTSSSLVVLTSPSERTLKFEDLLRAPAELLGRGRHGSIYKISLASGETLAVKRIKDWTISSEEFKERMQRIYQVNHPNVMRVIAFYCSKQEKLLVYEYKQNGSVFKLLQEIQNGQVFEWGSRLSLAARVAEALAFLHEELSEDGIAHGNLKSTNIMIDDNLEPRISEYGLMMVENHDQPFIIQRNSPEAENSKRIFKVDVHCFGVILLELLTGKVVQHNGLELARWMHSVVREEWTAEVFDRSLTLEGASKERMVNLLQVALKCINNHPDERPTMKEVAAMINTIKEEQESSMIDD